MTEKQDRSFNFKARADKYQLKNDENKYQSIIHD